MVKGDLLTYWTNIFFLQIIAGLFELVGNSQTPVIATIIL